MDEIDAVGRHRGAGLGGGHDEREQTLNQLLVEMDGFEMKDNIILIAPPTALTSSTRKLLRPGRFDRQIVVDRPDRKGRQKILEVHTRGKPLAKAIDLDTLAGQTPASPAPTFRTSSTRPPCSPPGRASARSTTSSWRRDHARDRRPGEEDARDVRRRSAASRPTTRWATHFVALPRQHRSRAQDSR